MSEERARSLEDAIARAEEMLPELEAIEVTPPSLTFAKQLTFHRGGRTIRLLHFEGHTLGDVVVHLPEDRIVITGDLVDEIPSGRRSFLKEWVESLNEVERLDFDFLIPGHGRVFEGKSQVRLVRALMERILEQVSQVVETEPPFDDKVLLRQIDACLEHDTRAELARITAPTLRCSLSRKNP